MRNRIWAVVVLVVAGAALVLGSLLELSPTLETMLDVVGWIGLPVAVLIYRGTLGTARRE